MVFSIAMRAFSLHPAKLTAARIPSIKFRKGGLATSHQQAAGGSSGAQVKKTQEQGGTKQAAGARGTRTIIVDELPPRFKRTPLSPEEIECINGGGIA